jgi:hypothetical protein
MVTATAAGALSPMTTPDRAAPVDQRMTLGLPAYFLPGGAWSSALAGAPTVRYLIANPSSGPGAAADLAYARVVSSSHEAGVEVLGYVSTCWGARPVDEVQREVLAYRDWYGITSIFFDEASSSARELPRYRRLAATVRRSGGRVALNPGTVPDEGYADLADLLVVFEGPFSAYCTWSPPTWQDRYPRQRFWHLVYDTPGNSLVSALRAAARRSAGVVHVTDGVMDNPWGRLPSYLSEALDEVRALNR